MKREHPILFSGPLVRAILKGEKTQTRRVMKPQPEPRPDAAGWWWPCASVQSMVSLGDDSLPYLSPYGGPTHRLYVRESYCPRYFDGGRHAYRADWDGSASDVVTEPKWTPSIYMPKAAARIWLEVTEVRVERLQDITEEDARAEGMDWAAPLSHHEPDEDPREVGYVAPGASFALPNFRELWDRINGKRPGCSWDNNPWVWVVGFKPLLLPSAGGGS